MQLENAISFFGRRAKALEAFKGGSQAYGYFDAASFQDPLFGGDFHDLDPGGGGNQKLRDAGMFPDIGSVEVLQPAPTFQVPEGYDDTGFVMEFENAP